MATMRWSEETCSCCALAWHGYRHRRELAGIDCAFDPTLLQHELGWTADDPQLARLLWHQAPPRALRLRRPESAATAIASELDALRAP